MNQTVQNSSNSSDVLQTILNRRSVKNVVSPGPSKEQVALALQCATTAPDHGALRVWRFGFIEQPEIVSLGERAIHVLETLGRPLSEEKARRTRDWLKEVPLLVAMAYQMHHDNPKVPDVEQALSMGAAVMNFQNAMHAMGFASFWSTGLGTFTEEIPTELGFDPLDYQFVGFLAVGTPRNEPAVRKPVDVSVIGRWCAPGEI
ncbi:nitroreductase family protein [Orrella sp. 11846]|uniref:nitroreductase family protein n=1 Tax=Orrella sp. 11846 TaxID=3409913 RepID=UPI003B5B615D